MSRLMVAVFNHSTARFFRGANDGQVVEVSSMICPEAKLHERELSSDIPSRMDSSSGTHQAYEPRTTAKEKITQEFAHSIAGWLESARVHNEYGRLVLAGPPAMLGAVRKALSAECRKMTIEECHKNLVDSDIATMNMALSPTVRIMEKSDLGQ